MAAVPVQQTSGHQRMTVSAVGAVQIHGANAEDALPVGDFACGFDTIDGHIRIIKKRIEKPNRI